MAAEQGVTVDEEGFRALMKEQRDRARADARAKRTGSVDVLAYRRLLAEHGPTDWQAYDTLRTDSRVLGVVSDARTTTPRRGGRRRARSPASSWTGRRSTPSPAVRSPTPASSPGTAAAPRCIDVQRPVKGLVAHQVRVLEGELREGTELDRRGRLRVAAVGVPGALGHARRARRAAPGARPAGAAVGLLQPARATCGWTSPGRARSPAAAHRHRGRRQRRRPRRPRASPPRT